MCATLNGPTGNQLQEHRGDQMGSAMSPAIRLPRASTSLGRRSGKEAERPVKDVTEEVWD